VRIHPSKLIVASLLAEISFIYPYTILPPPGDLLLPYYTQMYHLAMRNIPDKMLHPGASQEQAFEKSRES
jgi:hypothetical protein